MAEPIVEPARVLIVEDDAEFSRLLQRVFKLNGHDVACEFNGQDALKRLTEEKFDLLVLDQILPGMVGRIVLSELDKIENQPAVLLISALGKLVPEDASSEKRPQVFLRKPFTLAQLIEQSHALLAALRYGTDAQETLPQKEPEVAGQPAEQSPQNAIEELEYNFESPEDFLNEYFNNLAHGGLFVATDRPLELGQPVQVILHTPNILDTDIVVSGHVAYTKKDPTGVGVTLSTLSDEAYQAFQDAVEKIKNAENRERPRQVLLHGETEEINVLAQALEKRNVLNTFICTEARELRELSSIKAPDLVVLRLDEITEEHDRLMVCLKGDIETAHVPVLAIGPERLQTKYQSAGVDRFVASETETPKLVDLVRSMLDEARRSHQRVPFQNVVEMDVNDCTLFADGVDLSEGGLCVVVQAKLGRNDRFQVRIPFSGLEAPMNIEARVAWTRKLPRFNGVRAGLMFVAPNQAARNQVRAYLFYSQQVQSDEELTKTADVLEHVQRRHVRAPYSAHVAVQVTEDTFIYGTGLDISVGGIGLSAKSKFEVGQTLSLALPLPAQDVPIEIKARVVSSQHMIGQVWRSGFMFDNASEKIAGWVRSYVHESLERSTLPY